MKSIKYFFIGFVYLLIILSSANLIGQQVIGVSVKSGYGLIGYGDYEISSGDGYRSLYHTYRSTPTISVIYNYDFFNKINISTELNLSRYVGHEYSSDTYSYSTSRSNLCIFSFYTFGIPINIAYQIKRTHISTGLSTKYSLYGRQRTMGTSNSSDSSWDEEQTYGPLSIFMYGYHIAIAQEIYDNFLIELSFDKYNIITPFKKTFCCNNSHQLNIGFIYYFTKSNK